MKINWFALRKITHAMWFLPAVFSAFAILVVALAYFSSYLFPESINADNLPVTVSTSAVRSILTIVASSMLAVAVFSLSTMVNVIANVSQSTSPRAVGLIVADRTVQTSISIFIGAFLFSIVSIIGLSGEIYSTGGRLVLFIAAAIVVVAVVWALIRWIGHISTIGRVEETLRRVEKATSKALNKYGSHGLYGCNRTDGPLAFEHHLTAQTVGFVQYFDRDALQEIANDNDIDIEVLARPGAYVDYCLPIAATSDPVDEDCLSKIAEAFTLGRERTFEFDPEFGLTVLSEIGIKAMSKAINDPGTAVQTVTSQTRVLADWTTSRERKDEERRYSRLFMAPQPVGDLIAASFGRHARECDSPEVKSAVLRGLGTLVRMAPQEFGEAALKLAREIRQGSVPQRQPAGNVNHRPSAS